ncbi:zf-HC2 domain-containing protein [Pyrinomonas sp.]|uniref:anti-sigma factor family protein n=1 Tax=Pyrinomonas sp. TaxID=2080306 RepID=UPI00331C4C2C
MFCEEAQQHLALYLDDGLSSETRVAVEMHLAECPVCRAHLAELQAVLRGLRTMQRPAPPPDLACSISQAIAIERAARRQAPPRPLRVRFADWLRPRLMPYTIGSLASLFLFIALLSAISPHLRKLHELERVSEAAARVTWLDEMAGFNPSGEISPLAYVASRAPFTPESPSLNPQGALASLKWREGRVRIGRDEMVVIADVFSSGYASLAEVVQPPHDRRALEELEEALRRAPAFVPATLDQRPQTMRVVFVVHRVDVRERSF